VVVAEAGAGTEAVVDLAVVGQAAPSSVVEVLGDLARHLEVVEACRGEEGVVASGLRRVVLAAVQEGLVEVLDPVDSVAAVLVLEVVLAGACLVAVAVVAAVQVHLEVLLEDLEAPRGDLEVVEAGDLDQFLAAAVSEVPRVD